MGGDAARLLPTFVLVCALAFWGWCVVDFAGTDERELRTFSRTVWVVVLVLGSVVGGLLWVTLGRPERAPRR